MAYPCAIDYRGRNNNVPGPFDGYRLKEDRPEDRYVRERRPVADPEELLIAKMAREPHKNPHVAPAQLVLQVDKSAGSLIVGQYETILKFLVLLQKHMELAHLDESKIELRSASDPEDDFPYLIVRVLLQNQSEDNAQRFYKSFAGVVDVWLRTLETAEKQQFLETIIFQVRALKDA